MLLRERAGTPWDGQWMGAFSWRREGPWSGLPNGPMLDEHWTGLLPSYVLTGFPSTAFGGLVDFGMAVGWLHLAAAFAKRSFLGKAFLVVADLRPHLPASARKSARAACFEGAVGESSARHLRFAGLARRARRPGAQDPRQAYKSAGAVAGQANNAGGNDNAQRNFGLDRGRPHAGACVFASLGAEQSAAGRSLGRLHPKDRRGRRLEYGSGAA